MQPLLYGVLWTRVQTYEKGTTAVAGTGAGTGGGTKNPGSLAQPAKKVPQVTDSDHIRGNKNANVTLVEYTDLECPFCKSFHPTMQQVLKTYGDKVRWVYRHFPLSFHANAQKEAEAAECAAELGGKEAFWSFVDKIFERTKANGTGFALTDLAPLAGELGLDKTAFQTCLDSGKYAQKVKDQMTKGSEEGVTGTPGTIVISTKGKAEIIPGALPFEQVKTIVDAALK